jgi:hypothetical protein
MRRDIDKLMLDRMLDRCETWLLGWVCLETDKFIFISRMSLHDEEERFGWIFVVERNYKDTEVTDYIVMESNRLSMTRYRYDQKHLAILDAQQRVS